jgi:hypothetical protein
VNKDQESVFAEKGALRNYFFKDFVGGFTSTLALQIKLTVKNEEFTKLLTEVPDVLAQLLSNNIEDAELLDGMKCIFDHESRIYKFHCLAEIGTKTKTEELPAEPSEVDKGWRQTIDIGDVLDAVKTDPEQKIKCWARAKVIELLSGSRIKVSFENDCKLVDREFSINSSEIALSTTMTSGEEWRQAVKKDDRVDCYDSTGVWYASTVLDVQKKDY